MKNISLILVVLLVLLLSACKETYTSVDVTYIDYEKEVTKVWFVSNSNYNVTVFYANEEYVCEWGSNPSHNERGDVLKVIIEYCEVKE